MLSSLWIHEQYQNTILSLKVKEVLYRKQSQYQLVEIVDTEDWGRTMMLDGCMMVTEKDEFFYHECIAHLPVNLLENVTNVLVLGGGDGGTVRELAKYSQLESIKLVEIDGDVISSAREYMPFVGCGFDSPKVEIIVQDANEYLNNSSENIFDIVICDGSDPVGFAEVLIQQDFYQKIQKVLKDNGVFITQSGSPLSQPNELKTTYANLNKVFSCTSFAWSIVPTYPGASWSFLIASNNNIADLSLNKEGVDSQWWHKSFVPALMSQPKFIQDIVSD